MKSSEDKRKVPNKGNEAQKEMKLLRAMICIGVIVSVVVTVVAIIMMRINKTTILMGDINIVEIEKKANDFTAELDEEQLESIKLEENEADAEQEEDVLLEATDDTEASREDNNLVEEVEEESAADTDAETETVNDDEYVSNPTVVWIGDSLTQGSLGDDGDDYINAPFAQLIFKYGVYVEGYGFYGSNTHDALWRYKDETQENQTVDPNKVYIFWLGSNDWAIGSDTPNADTTNVIDEIDTFISKGKLDKYIVMGTTARKELRETVNGKPLYDIINDDLRNHYGDHYLEVEEYIPLSGYGPDDIHLTVDIYHKIADIVYEELINRGYLK